MARIAWTEQMSVGVVEIDRQHQRLIDLFNGLEEGLVRGGASRIIRGLFAELASYTKYHFSTEANILRRSGFRGLERHTDAHADFVSRLGELESLLQREGAEPAAIQANRLLRSWILRHIVVADRVAFGAHRPRPGVESGSAAAAAPDTTSDAA